MVGRGIDDIDINIEPYVFTTDISGVTKYTGTSSGSANPNAPVWKIKKEWKIGNTWYMGFPNGKQTFEFIWNSVTTYTYL
jgi:hypothetical protein